MSKSKYEYGISVISVLLLIWTVFLLTFLFFIFRKKNYTYKSIDISENNNDTNNSFVIHEDEKIEIELPKLPDINFIEFNNELRKVFAGDIEFSRKEGDVNRYDFGKNGYYGMVVYQYIPGKTNIPSRYESFRWDRDIEVEINQYKSLKLGGQVAKFYMGVGEGYDRYTYLKEIGSKRYAIVDTSFSPAGTENRYYYVYDSNNEQLIYIYINFYDIFNLVNKSDENKLTIYPEYVQDFLNEFEKKALSFY